MQQINAVQTVWTSVTVAALIASATPAAGRQNPAVPTESLRATAMALDPGGNLVVIDGGRVRKLTPGGVIQTVSGDGRQGHRGDGGPAAEAGFEYPADVAIDAKGVVYIADNLGHRVRAIAPDGKIRTFAGTGEPGYSGDGGPATAARLQSPVRLALDSAGNLYIADSSNSRIRKVSASGIVSTVAGNGKAGFSGDQGPATSATIGQVSGLAIDKTGNIYIADFDNARIRKVTTATGIIATVAGNGTEASAGDGGLATQASIQPFNLSIDAAGNLFVVEVNRVRRIGTDGVIRTVIGNGTAGFSGDGGPAPAALLRGPTSVAVDAKGNVFIADSLNGRIRKVAADGMIATIAGSSPPAVTSSQPTPATLAARGRGAVIQQQIGITASPPPQPTVAPSGRPSLLETRLGMIPRPPLTTLKDCGHVTKTPAQTVVSCIQEALRAKSPFVASFEQGATSSSPSVIGLGGTAPDGVVQVVFEGTPGAAGSRVSAARDCREPQFTITSGAVQLVCK